MRIARQRRLVVLFIVLTCATLAGQSRATSEHWVGSWMTAVVALPATPAQGPATPAAPPQATNGQAPPAPGAAAAQRPRFTLNNQTIRQVVHTSIGGNRVRVMLTNAFGTTPLVVDAAHIALHDKDEAIVPGGKPLLFTGRPDTTIPGGAVMFSDPVDLHVPPFAELAIDVHLPGDLADWPSPLTMHSAGLQTSYVSMTGNHAGAASLPVVTTTQSVYLLGRVEVVASPGTLAIATFGDSITDGTRSTPNTNRRWPDHLARRLARQSPGRYAVLNAAIAGNRLLSESTPAFGISALARFDRDVLVQSGVTHVVVMEGINDIGGGRENPVPSAADLIAVHQQLIDRAHARGLKAIGATLTPFEGAAYFTAVGEEKRRAVNEWIRTSKAYDGVIDFDAVVRDPAQPTKFLPVFDSGDHLHPSDAGYEAMGNAVDLRLFR